MGRVRVGLFRTRLRPGRILHMKLKYWEIGVAFSKQIYRNVQTWQNQPSVVSSVEYELVEVNYSWKTFSGNETMCAKQNHFLRIKGRNLMPKVMVCPRTPNANEILRRLMLRHPELVKATSYSSFSDHVFPSNSSYNLGRDRPRPRPDPAWGLPEERGPGEALELQLWLLGPAIHKAWLPGLRQGGLWALQAREAMLIHKQSP